MELHLLYSNSPSSTLGCVFGFFFLLVKNKMLRSFYYFIYLEFIPSKIDNCRGNLVKLLSVLSEHLLNSKHNV